MNDWLYLLLIPALLLLIWFWPESGSARSVSRHKQDKHNAPAQNPFHAISIQPCAKACSAATALRGKRFLANEAMTLPLADCDTANCQCTYKHYADRRKGEERRRASIAMREHFSKYEQRHGRDRRRHQAYQ